MNKLKRRNDKFKTSVTALNISGQNTPIIKG